VAVLGHVLRKVVGVHGHVQLAVLLANKFKLQKHFDISHIDVLIPSSIANTHTQDTQSMKAVHSSVSTNHGKLPR
jgi:hypothetical protein